MNKAPIEQWASLIHSNLPEADLADALKKIYRESRPALAELIVESYCPASCHHCIYPYDYHKYNTVLTEQQWERIIDKLYSDFDLKTYIFGGRYLSKKIIHVASYIKNNFPDTDVGIIADCRDLEVLLDEVINLDPDWLDISIDGLRREHDLQRCAAGAFDQALNIIRELKKSSSITRLNILSCLTKINQISITDMIEFLNAEGFKNFFVSPVTIVQDFRPDKNLAPSNDDFINFLHELMARFAAFDDSWIELNIYDVRYYAAIKHSKLLPSFNYNNGLLEYVCHAANNDLHINFFPMSLTGLNELIVNTNGDIILPKVVAMGAIDRWFIFDNMLKIDSGGKFFREMVQKKAFDFYLAELLHEKRMLEVT